MKLQEKHVNRIGFELVRISFTKTIFNTNAHRNRISLVLIVMMVAEYLDVEPKQL